MNRTVKPDWLVRICDLLEQKQWCKRMKNLSRVLLDKHKKPNTSRELKEIEFKNSIQD